MWMDGEWLGGWRIRARMLEVSVGMIVMKGLRLLFHMAIVPPLALEVSSARSGWWRSSELRWEKKFPWNVWKRRFRLCWNICGSVRKIRLGWCSLMK